MKIYKNFFKRFFDIFFSVLGLPFLLSLYILIFILIKLEDKGPVIYKSLRFGQKGIPFKMYKFRSMVVNAPDIRLSDGSTYNSKDDPRVTIIGKLIRESSLDEIPQLINILMGQMSFIGPRPDLYSDADISEERILILKAKPGLTGYNQAYFRNETDMAGKFKNDLYYVQHISFLFDMKIIIKTVSLVLKREKMYKKLD